MQHIIVVCSTVKLLNIYENRFPSQERKRERERERGEREKGGGERETPSKVIASIVTRLI